MRNILFPEGLRKCDYCDCTFTCSRGMTLHLATFGRHVHGNAKSGHSLSPRDLDRLGWRPSSFDDSEYCSVSKNRRLEKMVKQRGKTVLGDHEYTVSNNGKWLKRRKRK